MKVLTITRVKSVEKAELLAYQLKDVAQSLFNLWQEDKVIDASPLDWEKFKAAFLDWFFTLQMREENLLEFIDFHQGNMIVKEYALKFTQQSRCTPTTVVNPRVRMKMFVLGLSEMADKKFRTTMLINELEIYCLMVHHNN